MIIKVKTFSGNSYFLSENEYFKMFAENEEERSKPDIAKGIKSGAKAAGAVIGTGALLGGGLGLYGGHKVSKIMKEAVKELGGDSTEIKGYKRRGALVGAGAGALNKYTLGAAAAAGLGYGAYKAYKGKKKKNK